jgi:hypothetical protein
MKKEAAASQGRTEALRADKTGELTGGIPVFLGVLSSLLRKRLDSTPGAAGSLDT